MSISWPATNTRRRWKRPRGCAARCSRHRRARHHGAAKEREGAERGAPRRPCRHGAGLRSRADGRAAGRGAGRAARFSVSRWSPARIPRPRRSRACEPCPRRRRSAGSRPAGATAAPTRWRARSTAHASRRWAGSPCSRSATPTNTCPRSRPASFWSGPSSPSASTTSRAGARARPAATARTDAQRVGAERRRDRHVRARAVRRSAGLGARVADRVRAVLHGGMPTVADFLNNCCRPTTSSSCRVLLRRRLLRRAGLRDQRVVSVPMKAPPRHRWRRGGADEPEGSRRNVPAMIVWGTIIVALTAAGFALFFAGLVVTVPVIGHATWHAYPRRRRLSRYTPQRSRGLPLRIQQPIDGCWIGGAVPARATVNHRIEELASGRRVGRAPRCVEPPAVRELQIAVESEEVGSADGAVGARDVLRFVQHVGEREAVPRATPSCCRTNRIRGGIVARHARNAAHAVPAEAGHVARTILSTTAFT